MTPYTQDRPSSTPQTAGAILLTALLVSSPLTASATTLHDPARHSSTASTSATVASASDPPSQPELGGSSQPGPGAGSRTVLGGSSEGGLGGSFNSRTDNRLGGTSGTVPELGSSQEGSWFLGRSVDSVLGPGQWFTTDEGRTWFGAYRTFPDEFAYCVDAGLKTPHSRHFPGDVVGEPVTAAASAWALGQRSQSDSAHVQAALSAIVRLDDAIPHRHSIEPGHPADLGAEFADAAAQFTTISEDAAKFAGPYTLSVDIRARTMQAYEGEHVPPLDMKDTGEESSATQEVPSHTEEPPLLRGFPLEAVVSLTSASGHQMTGHRVRLSATGARTGEDSIVIGDEPTVVTLTELAADRITVDAVAADLPATSVVLHRPRGLGSDRVQAVVTAGEPTTVTEQAIYDPQPELPTPEIPEKPETPEVPSPERLVPQEPDESHPNDSASPDVNVFMPRPTTPPRPSVTPEQPSTPEVPAEQTERPPETEAADPSPIASPVASPGTSAPATSRPPTQVPLPVESAAPERTPAPEAPASESPRPSGETSTGPQQAPIEEETVPVSLPRTGTNSTMAIGLAITLVAVGVGALTVARRR